MRDKSLITLAVHSQDGRRGLGGRSDSAAEDAFAFCVAQGLLRQPANPRTYSAREIYRLKLVRVIMGSLKVSEELNTLRTKLPESERAAARAAPDLAKPEKSLSMIRDLIQDFPERI